MELMIDELKYNHIVDEIEVIKNKKIVLFGAGLEGQIAFEFFRKNHVDIYCYCDNNSLIHNTYLNGVKIISSETLKSLKDIIVFITIKTKIPEVKLQLDKLGIKYFIFSEYRMQIDIKQSMNKLTYVYNELLKDKRSKNVYASIIKSKLYDDLKYIKNIYEDNAFYCLPEFKDTIDEYLIDAGAYVGDTVEKFIWNCTGRFKKIYAFEPGLRQYTAMKNRVERLGKEWALEDNQVECINAGLGESNTVMPLFENKNNLLTSNFICKSSNNIMNEVNVYSLDSYFENKKVTMIKVDIEGFEMELLRGAVGLIKNQKPKLAISIYHKYEDLYEIPMFIKEIVPEYRMAIRHHSTNLSETVLYCWIE